MFAVEKYFQNADSNLAFLIILGFFILLAFSILRIKSLEKGIDINKIHNNMHTRDIIKMHKKINYAIQQIEHTLRNKDSLKNIADEDKLKLALQDAKRAKDKLINIAKARGLRLE